MNQYDFYDEEEELDLLKLVSTNSNEANQYLIFEGLNGELYAKNVSKINEIVIYKDIDIAHNHDKKFVIGTGDVRSQMITLVDFNEWMGNGTLSEDKRELVIIAHYGGHIVGIVVEKVENIITIEADEMSDNSSANSKSTFITKIKLNAKERLCTIFDSDKFLLDVFDDISLKTQNEDYKLVDSIESKKLVLAADDSKFIRSMISQLCEKINIHLELYENGLELSNALKNKNAQDIGLIITDLEMPIMSGRELIAKIRADKTYDAINIIVHTNMSNQIMSDELISLGANEIIGKVNMLQLAQSVKKHIR